jgi:hypothetical protein
MIFIDFFFKSTPLISKKIAEDFKNLNKNFSSQTSKRNVFLSFFKGFVAPIAEKITVDINNLKNNIDSSKNNVAPLNSLVISKKTVIFLF